MANKSTVAQGAADATVPTPAGPHEGLPGSAVPKVALGITQRASGLGGATREGAQTGRTEATKERKEQLEFLNLQQKQRGLLEQQKDLLEQAPLGPRLSKQAGQTAHDVVTSIMLATGGYLTAKGIAQVPMTIAQEYDSPGAVHLPPIIVNDGLDNDRIPLGADATPAPLSLPGESRSVEAGRLAQMLQAGKSASGMAALDAAVKLTVTAITASTPEQRGEGMGAAGGSFTGAVLGAMLGSRTKAGAPVVSMMFGFAGDKVGGAVGKELMATPAGALHGSSSTGAGNGQADAASPSLWESLSATLGVATGVGLGAAAHKHRDRLRRFGWGRVDDEPYPLGADAGPSPTDINPPAEPSPTSTKQSAGRWATVQGAVNDAGKLPWLEAGLKGAYTFATAKTPEEKGMGYGGAIGGAIGTVLGGGILGKVVGPTYGMFIGNLVGDKVGSLIGGWIGKTFFKPADRKDKAEAAQGDPRQATNKAAGEVSDTQKDTRRAEQLSPNTPHAVPADKYAWGLAAQSRESVQGYLPPAPMVLPDVASIPTASQGVTTQPTPQQLTFTANMPITVQGRVDAPNLLTEQLEAAVKRVMEDLFKRAPSTQMYDPAHAY
ncbi:hypothetical protein [Pseudomonas oryziphila]|uniref:hypothetical protein n=1 Tax=Pseudomonas oryziphila TaxID=2894079 RepID=UPI001237665A|nr:hypothetical protein [Pseudomonas oryziphila]